MELYLIYLKLSESLMMYLEEVLIDGLVDTLVASKSVILVVKLKVLMMERLD